jgi:hypothetical protein
MIRIQPPTSQHPEPLSGTIEGLGTGDKRQFSSETELIHLLRCWPADPTKMRAAGDLGKQSERHRPGGNDL